MAGSTAAPPTPTSTQAALAVLRNRIVDMSPARQSTRSSPTIPASSATMSADAARQVRPGIDYRTRWPTRSCRG
jgi:hypothetical protein